MWNPLETLRSAGLLAGEHEAVVRDAFEGVSKATGSAMTTVVFELGCGAKLFDHFVHANVVAARRMLALLNVVGLGGREGFEVKELIGKRLKLEVAMENGVGGPQPHITRFLPVEQQSKAKKK